MKNFFKKTLLVFTLVSIIQCSKDSNEAKPENPSKPEKETLVNFELSRKNAQMLLGETDKIDIKSGNGLYEIRLKKEGEKVAKVELSSDKKSILFKAIAVGNTTATIVDTKKKESIDIVITVLEKLKEFALEKESISIQADAVEKVNITSGNGQYTIQLAEGGDKIVSAKISDDEKSIELKGVSNGTTDVTITDTKKNVSKKIAVKVTFATFKIEKNEVIIKGDNTEKVNITSGNGQYTIQLADKGDKIVNAKLSDDKKSIELKGIGEGKTEVTVTDTKTNASQKIIVIVNFDQTFKIDNNNINIDGENTVKVKIISGNGQYTIKVADQGDKIVSAKLSEDKKEIELKGISHGTTEVTVTDTKTNATQKITVTVTFKALLIEKENITLKIGASTIVNITSGNGDYKITTNESQVQAKLSDDKKSIEIKAIASGTTVVTVTDIKKNESKKITVIVEGFKPLKLDKTNIEVNENETINLNITSGNGNYKIEQNPDVKKIASVTLSSNSQTIQVKGIIGGKIAFNIKDVTTNESIQVTGFVKILHLKELDEKNYTEEAKKLTNLQLIEESKKFVQEIDNMASQINKYPELPSEYYINQKQLFTYAKGGVSTLRKKLNNATESTEKLSDLYYDLSYAYLLTYYFRELIAHRFEQYRQQYPNEARLQNFITHFGGGDYSSLENTSLIANTNEYVVKNFNEAVDIINNLNKN